MDQLPLRDLHLPESIGWWPPAMGWWLVLSLLLIGILGATLLIQRRRRITPLKRALEGLAEIEFQSDTRLEDKLQSISAIMKRFALSIAGRDEVAGLTGDAWMAWLCARAGDQAIDLEVVSLLKNAPYQRRAMALDLEAVLLTTRQLLIAISQKSSYDRAKNKRWFFGRNAAKD